jgi:predicted RNase H-like HicB family nuclease
MSVKSSALFRKKNPVKQTVRRTTAGKSELRGRVGKKSSDLRKPFRSEILQRAAVLAEHYQIILECDQGQWHGRGLELPHVFGDGATPELCIQSTRQALTAAVAYLLEKGSNPPSPARNGKRTQQVNVRLTAEEKTLLEAVAHRKGFQGLSDYLRAAALEPVGRG